MDAMKTGEFLAALRRSHGYTQQQVAEQLNLSNKTVSKWESGGGFPDVTVLPALAELYGVTADDILAGERLHRTEEQSTAARHNYLLSRTALRFKICYVIAITVPILDCLRLLRSAWEIQRGVLYPWLPTVNSLFVMASYVVLVIGALLMQNGLQMAADICTEDEISEAKRAFIRQCFSLAAFNALCLSYHFYGWRLIGLPILVLIPATWYLLRRHYGRLFPLWCSILLLLSCLGIALYSVFFAFDDYVEFPKALLLLFSLWAAGAIAIAQLFPRKKSVAPLKKIEE